VYVTLMESDTLQGFGRTEIGTSPGGGCVRNPRNLDRTTTCPPSQIRNTL
jgi:hypothetical protein